MCIRDRAKTDQQLADSIDKVGAPKVDQGARTQQDAVAELKQTAQGYLDIQKKLAGLPSNDQAKFADGLRSVGDQVQRLAQQSTDALNKLQSGDLATAMTCLLYTYVCVRRRPHVRSDLALHPGSRLLGARFPARLAGHLTARVAVVLTGIVPLPVAELSR